MKFLNALNCKNTGRPPVWLMRQAGRYLPQYRKIRQNRNLYSMFHNPETIVEVTKLPVNLLGVDAAILFTDILTVLEGLNIRYDFREGPVILDPISKIESLPPEYPHIKTAIQSLKTELSVPLIGFCGGPFTIATYMIEGKSSHDHKKTKQMLYQQPEDFEKLIEKITDASIAYLQCQIDAGIDAIQIFDSWANVLSIWEFRKYCLAPMQKIVNAVNKPVILFCRGSSYFASELAALQPAGISIDWNADMADVRKAIPDSIALQGNLDPMALYAPRSVLKESLDRILKGMRDDPGYIFNLGHGILPDIPVENVQFLVDYVRS